MQRALTIVWALLNPDELANGTESLAVVRWPDVAAMLRRHDELAAVLSSARTPVPLDQHPKVEQLVRRHIALPGAESPPRRRCGVRRAATTAKTVGPRCGERPPERLRRLGTLGESECREAVARPSRGRPMR